MAPIYVMAIITFLAAGGLWLGLGALMAGRHRKWAWVVLLALPFSPLINQVVKRPIMLAVNESLDLQPGQSPPLIYWVLALLLAPITEEAIKLAPVLFPPLARWVKEKGTALWLGLFLGIGFGLSEVGYLAWSIAQAPQYSQYPWYYFTGFAQERLMVVAIHGVMTAVAVLGIARGWWRGWLGYLSAIGLHCLVNLGALLAQAKVIPVVLASLWTMGVFAGLLLLLAPLYKANRALDQPSETILFQRSAP